MIVSSVHTCSGTARKQRIDIWPDETLTDLGNTIAGGLTAGEFVTPGGAFFFQYYDSDEDDMVGIPRYAESQYLAKEFRGKKLTVVPVLTPPTQPQEESLRPTQAQLEPSPIEREIPKKEKRKERKNKRLKREEKQETIEVSDSDRVEVVGFKPGRARPQKTKSGQTIGLVVYGA